MGDEKGEEEEEEEKEEEEEEGEGREEGEGGGERRTEHFPASFLVVIWTTSLLAGPFTLDRRLSAAESLLMEREREEK